MQLRFQRTCKRRIRLLVFRLRNLLKEKFECPICIYRGPFEDLNLPTGPRKHARCPRCGSFERHRLQYLALQLVLDELNTAQMKMLHFAPEVFLKDFFSKRFGTYETADLHMKGVNHKVDLQNLPFPDSTYDLVFASHVLEHIPNDKKAIQEIRRILKPGGIAILPVPLVTESTIEYPEPNPHESYHVRAPGVDYFDRYTPYFSRIEKHASDSLPEKYQLFTYEDKGDRHIDIVPICYV